MRIEAYTQIQQLYNTNKVTIGSSVAKQGRLDEVQISSVGLNIQNAKAAVNASPDIRYDVVEPLKKAVQDGTYEVSGESFAEKLMKKYEEMR